MTGKRNNRVVSYLNDDEKSKLKQWANETGESQSTLVRKAIREYLDLDRGDRVERQLAELTDEMEDLRRLVERQQTHTHPSPGLSNAEAATDGGGPSEYTAENVEAADPPPTNASVTRKVDYLVALVRAKDMTQLHRVKFREANVDGRWDYADSDRANALVQKTIDRLGYKQHPQIDPLYVPPEKHRELTAEARASAETAAENELEELSADD
jgi:predicted transcriptional regulator